MLTVRVLTSPGQSMFSKYCISILCTLYVACNDCDTVCSTVVLLHESVEDSSCCQLVVDLYDIRIGARTGPLIRVHTAAFPADVGSGLLRKRVLSSEHSTYIKSQSRAAYGVSMLEGSSGDFLSVQRLDGNHWTVDLIRLRESWQVAPYQQLIACATAGQSIGQRIEPPRC